MSCPLGPKSGRATGLYAIHTRDAEIITCVDPLRLFIRRPYTPPRVRSARVDGKFFTLKVNTLKYAINQHVQLCLLTESGRVLTAHWSAQFLHSGLFLAISSLHASTFTSVIQILYLFGGQVSCNHTNITRGIDIPPFEARFALPELTVLVNGPS